MEDKDIRQEGMKKCNKEAEECRQVPKEKTGTNTPKQKKIDSPSRSVVPHIIINCQHEAPCTLWIFFGFRDQFNDYLIRSICDLKSRSSKEKV